MVTFDVVFERIFKNEGSYQSQYNDRGNWTTGIVGKGELKGTKYGISAMTYPDLDIKNLTIEQAKAIYKRDWWDKMGMERFPKELKFQLFDMAIHSGIGEANKTLQKAVGVKMDGDIGPKTLEAIRNTEGSDILIRFLAYRLEFLTYTKAWEENSKGFARRIAHNLLLGAEDN